MGEGVKPCLCAIWCLRALGRRSYSTCNGFATTPAYDLANDPLGESYSGGVLDGLATTNRYDNLLRRTNLAVFSSTTPILQYSIRPCPATRPRGFPP